jgi:hypothetical protein
MQCVAENDPVLASILAAPIDDTPETPEELEQVAQYEQSKLLIEHESLFATIAARGTA